LTNNEVVFSVGAKYQLIIIAVIITGTVINYKYVHLVSVFSL